MVTTCMLSLYLPITVIILNGIKQSSISFTIKSIKLNFFNLNWVWCDEMKSLMEWFGPLPFNFIPFLHLAQREKRNGVNWKACRAAGLLGAPFNQHSLLHWLLHLLYFIQQTHQSNSRQWSWFHSLWDGAVLLFAFSSSRGALRLQPPLTHSKKRQRELPGLTRSFNFFNY